MSLSPIFRQFKLACCRTAVLHRAIYKLLEHWQSTVELSPVSTTRVDACQHGPGWWVMETGHPSTRSVNLVVETGLYRQSILLTINQLNAGVAWVWRLAASVSVCLSVCLSVCPHDNSKANDPKVFKLKPGFHYPSYGPSSRAVNSARELWSITWHPSTQPVNSGREMIVETRL